MKKLTTVLIMLLMSSTAWADHSLADAMQDLDSLKVNVVNTMAANNVICDIQSSKQTYVIPGESTSWKQIALCYSNVEDLYNAREYFKEGGEFGFYGTPNLMGVLVAKYTWRDYQASSVISVSYQ